jgi:diguanylate cyclase (GGDEF)-like protein
VDDFKEVNDSLGHREGDQLLIHVASRLRHCLRPADTIARLGGDEFAILLEDYAHSTALSAVAHHILDSLRQPVELAGNQVVTQASIGIAVGGAEAEVDDLLRNADLAMYVVKGKGKGGHAMFSPEMHEVARARLELLADLRQAVDNQELVLHYQPKISLQADMIVGFEALVRWNHPRRGLIPPGEFIPLAEETGLIVELGAWVMREACRQLAEWRTTVRSGGASLTLAVNLSARQLAQDDLVDVIADVLAQTPLAPELLELEITETAIMNDIEAVIPVLHQLKSLGVSLAIDDFGTGYSSLNYLKQFPVDCLKIDRVFVGGLGRDARDSAVITAVIALARSLGMSSVAEGVETIEQLMELAALGCDQAQSFYLGRPVPADAVEELFIAAPQGEASRIKTVLVCDDVALRRTPV